MTPTFNPMRGLSVGDAVIYLGGVERFYQARDLVITALVDGWFTVSSPRLGESHTCNPGYLGKREVAA